MTTGAGVHGRLVDDRHIDPATGDRHRFQSSAIGLAYARRPEFDEVLPVLYLHGLSSKDIVPALTEFFGSQAGLSAAAITRLTKS